MTGKIDIWSQFCGADGGPGHEGPDLTDTIMLVSIDPVNHNTALLSIPRDLWVKIPGDGYQKINAAYVYGKQQSKSKDEKGKDQAGLDLLDKTLEPILGVPIHYHPVVDFDLCSSVCNTFCFVIVLFFFFPDSHCLFNGVQSVRDVFISKVKRLI